VEGVEEVGDRTERNPMQTITCRLLREGILRPRVVPPSHRSDRSPPTGGGPRDIISPRISSSAALLSLERSLCDLLDLQHSQATDPRFKVVLRLLMGDLGPRRPSTGRPWEVRPRQCARRGLGPLACLQTSEGG